MLRTEELLSVPVGLFTLQEDSWAGIRGRICATVRTSVFSLCFVWSSSKKCSSWRRVKLSSWITDDVSDFSLMCDLVALPVSRLLLSCPVIRIWELDSGNCRTGSSLAVASLVDLLPLALFKSSGEGLLLEDGINDLGDNA